MGGITMRKCIRVVVFFFGKGKEDGWMRNERRGMCFERGIYGFISIRERLMNVLGEKKGKIGYSVS